MSYSNIKRFLATVMLAAFTAPSTLAVTGSEMLVVPEAVSSEVVTPQVTVPYRSSMLLNGNIKLTESNDTITLSLRDSDVKQVIRMFADKAGMNIVFHESVTGKVTLDLVNTPINEAFNLILQVSGLNYYQQGNAMIVMSKDTPDNAIYSKQEMMIFPINYVSASKIADFLNKNVFSMKKPGLSSVDAATVNSATNELIVFGMPGDVAIIKKVIEQFDKEPFSKTFVVNHTTPAEMAALICDVLLPSRGIGEKTGGSDSSEAAPSAEDAAMPGVTGFAASLESDLSGGGGDGEGTALKLGEGVLACSVSTAGKSSDLSAFDVKNLSIAYFPQRGTITMMGGSQAQAEMIEKFIKANDVKQPQAILEVSIVELNESGSKEFQNEWMFSSGNWSFQFDGSTTNGKRVSFFKNMVNGTYPFESPAVYEYDDETGELTSVTPPSQTLIPWSYVVPNTTYIEWRMNYLIENAKARVLANPKIIITNGQESTIDLTQDYVEKVTSEYLTSSLAGAGSTGTVQKTYEIADDLGIKVSLTPFISPEGYVTLNIAPEYSTVAGEVRSAGAVVGQTDLVATLLSRRNLNLKNIRIKDGETLIVGGMIQESEQKTVRKIPLLGDLPGVLGTIFRSTSTTKAKSELVIMITPKILNDDEGTIADSL